LVSSGLVKTHEEPNPGHGRRRVIEPLASKFELVATIWTQRPGGDAHPR
jgi:hypothetical protein